MVAFLKGVIYAIVALGGLGLLFDGLFGHVGEGKPGHTVAVLKKVAGVILFCVGAAHFR